MNPRFEPRFLCLQSLHGFHYPNLSPNRGSGRMLGPKKIKYEPKSHPSSGAGINSTRKEVPRCSGIVSLLDTERNRSIVINMHVWV